MIFSCLIVSAVQSYTMIIMRGHYFIDLIFGMFFAHYFFKLSILINPSEENEFVNKEDYERDGDVPLLENFSLR